MWQFWKWNGRYIQGDLVSTHDKKEMAIDRAKKEFNGGIIFTEEVRKRKRRVWVDDRNHSPIGIIVETSNGGATVSTG